MLTNQEKEEKRKIEDRLKELKQKECKHETLRYAYEIVWKCNNCGIEYIITEENERGYTSHKNK